MDKPHKRLVGWNKAVEMAEVIYRLFAAFPSDERFGLTSQMRRSAVSVASNIAEGAARSTRKEFEQFILIARSSLSELDTQLDICVRLGYVERNARVDMDDLLIPIDKMPYGLFRLKSD